MSSNTIVSGCANEVRRPCGLMMHILFAALSVIVASIWASFLPFAIADTSPSGHGQDSVSLIDQVCRDVRSNKVMSADVRQKYLDSMNEAIQRQNGAFSEVVRPGYLIAFAFDDSPQTGDVLRQYQKDDLAQWAMIFRTTRGMKSEEKYRNLLDAYTRSLDDATSGKDRRMSRRIFLVASFAAAMDEAGVKNYDNVFDLLQKEHNGWVKFELASILIVSRRPEILRRLKEYINRADVELSRCVYFNFNKALDCIWTQRPYLGVVIDNATGNKYAGDALVKTSRGAKMYLNQRIDELLKQQ